MTVGKKMNRIGGQRVVRSMQTSANLQNIVEEGRASVEEIAGALMGQDHFHAARRFFANSTEDEADDLDRLTGVSSRGRRLDVSCDDRGHQRPVAPAFPQPMGGW